MSAPEHKTEAATLAPVPSETEAGEGRGYRSRQVRSRGEPVGRYIIVDEVGAGGMGVVYAAYDPELDRRVALKLLHRDTSRNRKHARARFIREAKSMARLSHPNVITVFDVGSEGSEAFVAMEFIEGQTLADWIEARARPWTDVVTRFEKAGRGLAAAHAAKIVHRDFKPENVLLGADGRVLVTDFGLARADDVFASGSGLEDPEGDEEEPVAAVSIEPALTRTGAILGTPAYMPPEQRLGIKSDARADQFSFCVALYEGLYGVRPHYGEDAQELFSAMLEGRIREPPPGTKVPGRIRRVVWRGLDPKPENRFPSMEALLHELSPPRRTRGKILGLAAGAAAFGAGAAYLLATGSEEACDAGEAIAAEVWDEDARRRVKAVFDVVPGPNARDAWTRVDHSLQGWLGHWAEAHRELCVLERDGTRSADEIELRRECLDDSLRMGEASVSILAELGSDEIDRHGEILVGMPPPDRCIELEYRWLARGPKGQRDPERLRLSATIDRAVVLQRAGRLEESLVLAEKVLAQVRGREKYPATEAYAMQAVALAKLGLRHADALDAMLEAILVLIEVQSPGTAATVAVRLADEYLEDPRRLAEAEVLLRTCLSALRPVYPDGSLESEVRLALAEVLMHRGRFEESQAELDSVMAGLEDVPELYVAKSNALLDLGSLQMQRRELREALETTKRSLDYAQKAEGPVGPRTVSALVNLATISIELGDPAGALEYAQQALEAMETAGRGSTSDHAAIFVLIAGARTLVGEPAAALPFARAGVGLWVNVRGPGSARAAEAHATHSTVLSELGRHELALAELERALEIQRRLRGPEHPVVATLLNNMGAEAGERDDHAAARRYHEEALAIRLKTLGERDTSTAVSIGNLADVDAVEDKLDAAIEGYERAIEIWDTSPAAGSVYVSWPLHGLGSVLRRRGELTAARATLQRALRLRETNLAGGRAVADTRLELARVYAALEDPLRARALARSAAVAYREVDDEVRAKKAEAWLDGLDGLEGLDGD